MCNNETKELCENLRKPSTFVFINKHKIKIIPIAKKLLRNTLIYINVYAILTTYMCVKRR